MQVGQTVFAQLMDYIPVHEFRTCVDRYHGDYKRQRFSCWDQFLCMAFAQLTYRESLRDIETCLRALGPRLYHAGIRGAVSRSTLADRQRAARLAYLCRPGASVDRYGASAVRPRKFRGGVAADRLRAGLHHHRSLSFAVSLGALSHSERGREDAYAARSAWQYSGLRARGTRENTRDSHARPIADRSRFHLHHGPRLLDFQRLHVLHQALAFFIIRARKDFCFHRLSSQPIDKSSGLRCDQSNIRLQSFYTAKSYPEPLRRIRYYDATTEKNLVFLTNNFLLPTLTVTQLYKCRWQVELFFKWIKQHLRIKKFYGLSPNAVKTQLWIAISVYVLLAIVRKRLGVELSLYPMAQILSLRFLRKRHFYRLFRAFTRQPKSSTLATKWIYSTYNRTVVTTDN